jgi:hypothetical protein
MPPASPCLRCIAFPSARRYLKIHSYLTWLVSVGGREEAHAELDVEDAMSWFCLKVISGVGPIYFHIF